MLVLWPAKTFAPNSKWCRKDQNSAKKKKYIQDRESLLEIKQIQSNKESLDIFFHTIHSKDAEKLPLTISVLMLASCTVSASSSSLI